ncbi:unnamed protein product [Eruca vesicaria subsp. sativa]|uniref:Uncharacterized protein n=1 Tax=Eruca vesicaria subsp. sativa TaxID=29727 RepID=A0ABC8KR27_ERUVS|nr:unnamed protein product [Eruca vesicaria subsp. sativa]
MAGNKDLKMKGQLIEEKEETVKEAYQRAVVAKYNAEVEVYCIAGKLKLFEELFNDGVMNHVKDKLEKELALAHARLSDVKVPNLDWEKLGEPQMWR